MMSFDMVLLLAAFLCSIVAGLLFAFAIVVMPGIEKLDDAGFVRAFQAIDGVIQNNQPVFLFVWAGSVLAFVTIGVMSFWQPNGADRLLVIVAAIVYLFGVQLPTVTINVPLNNTLQKVDPAAMSDAACERARRNFEPRWNRWNAVRTACASFASILLLIVLLRV